MMHIVIPDDYQNAVSALDCFRKLAGHTVTIYHDTVKTMDALKERFKSADVLVLIRERTAITAELLAGLPNLKLIAQTGKGTAHIDLAACTKHGVAVSVGSGSPEAPAELTWMLIMAAMRRLTEAMTSMQAGRWQADAKLGRAVRGHTLGIYGYGKIGSLVAGYGRTFGMQVLIFGREGSLQRAERDGYMTVSSQRALFERADVVSLHLRLTPETRGIITFGDLSAMRDQSLFVNTSRAELVEEGALVAALRTGRPCYAAVDVYESEPVADPPLLRLPNVLCTPHIGYVEQGSYENYFGTAFDQVLAFASGTPMDIVNPEVLTTG
ncbi:MAG: D-2-hydroxyacid dehydrogenase family protein [Anaerolineae bacterium]